MRSSNLQYALLSIATLGAAAIPEGVVKFELRRQQAASTSTNSTLLQSLQLNDKWIPAGGYFIDLAVGTPPQQFEVLVDTGSSNLFFPNAQAPPCLAYQCPGGSFSVDASSSLNISEDIIFQISYVDGSLVTGNYSQDTLLIGDATLDNFTFAIANDIQVSPSITDGAQYGILGVSGQGQETDACPGQIQGCPGGFYIPTIHDALYSAGYTKSRSFSLYLDSVEEQKGSILFGGIDTAKFVGELTTLAVQPDASGDAQNGTYVGQDLVLVSVAGTIDGETVQLTDNDFNATTATIDSGAAKLQLPASVFSALDQLIPTAVRDSDGELLIPCDYANSNDTLMLTLSGYNDDTSVAVEVPASNLVVPYFGQDYNSTTLDVINGTRYCELGLSSGGSDLLLGDPFIRSIYINYNLDEHTISIAPASYNSDNSNIIVVGPGPVPSLNGTGASSSSAVSSPTSYTTSTASVPSGTTSGTPSTTTDTKPTCSPDGALICNGEKQFGLCNWGHVIWQDVALGTACKDDEIVGVGIYAADY